MLRLSNGVTIHQFGEPRLFIVAGSHGDEKAPVIAIESILTKKLKNDVWIISCLNKQGFADENRFYSGIKTRDGLQENFNLNREYRARTKLKFMKELQDIIKEYKPEIFLDMHEHIAEDTANDFIWSSLDNKNEAVESNLREFCRQHKVGIIYQPLTKEYRDSSDFFARRFGSLNAYSTETYKYNPIKRRVSMNKKFVRFFLKMIIEENK